MISVLIEAVHICAEKGKHFVEDGTTAQRAFSFKIKADSLKETADIIKHIQKSIILVDENGRDLLLDPFDTNRIL